MDIIKTKMLIERHIHGAFGVDINKAKSDDIIFLSQNLFKHGIGGFYPTLVTDSVGNIKRQISEIKKAASVTVQNSAKILGIHIEGVFINPVKKGIHDEKLFLELTKENFKLFEDDFIKTVTLAPELDRDLIDYLKSKCVQVQAGHCVGYDLEKCIGVTHLFNAMSGINHRTKSTALSALINNDIYTEIIADGVHVNEDTLRLVFKTKPLDKIILISDALPITKSDLKQTNFAGSDIFYDGVKATSKDGTLAGSTTLLDGIIKYLNCIGLFNPILIDNPYKLEKEELKGKLIWDKNYNLIDIVRE